MTIRYIFLVLSWGKQNNERPSLQAILWPFISEPKCLHLVRNYVSVSFAASFRYNFWIFGKIHGIMHFQTEFCKYTEVFVESSARFSPIIVTASMYQFVICRRLQSRRYINGKGTYLSYERAASRTSSYNRFCPSVNTNATWYWICFVPKPSEKKRKKWKEIWVSVLSKKF